jgi:hypothetical protein
VALALFAVVALPSVAHATIYTPNPSDIYDLDHNFLYTWRIPGLSVSGENITSATITFKQMYNWDSNPNDLFIHLLDTARTNLPVAAPPSSFGNITSTNDPDRGGSNGTCTDSTPGCNVNWFVDETTTTVGTSQLIDDFTNQRYWNNPDWVVAPGTANTYLTDRSFSPLGGNPVTADPGPDKNMANWSYVQDGTDGSGNKLYDYTYTFTAGQLQTLAAYISNGGDVALGLDSDCHFFNSGILFDIEMSPTAVPEPGTVLLFGSGLLSLWFIRRRALA